MTASSRSRAPTRASTSLRSRAPARASTAPGFELLIISDGGPALCERVERALSGAEPGRLAIMLREPQRTSAELLALGRALRTLTAARGALLIVNDRVDVALAVEADGVHLPEAGLPVRTARALLDLGPPPRWVGVSRHSAEGLTRAAEEGADYATLSPVHAVAGKAPPLGLEGFAAALVEARERNDAAARLPVFALGGVRSEDAHALQLRGARGVAVMREVLSAADPGASTARLLAALRAP